MTFSSYLEIIAKSVSETGYDEFCPSLCFLDGSKCEMKVLEGALHADGDEGKAMSWVELFIKERRTVFLAFRQGQRIITVLEIRGADAIRRSRIKVTPYSFEADHSDGET